MGRRCAWCGSVLILVESSSHPVSHGLCSGCLEELSASLQREGVRLVTTGRKPH